jgi:hypothetical protein
MARRLQPAASGKTLAFRANTRLASAALPRISFFRFDGLRSFADPHVPLSINQELT